MDEASIIVIVIVIGIIYSVFNIFTISVMFIDKKLRKRSANYPVISFLIGSAIQGLLPFPLYVYKILKHSHSDGKDVPGWMCDTYRFPYILCGHVMVLSIILISIDRLIAVKYPFHYPRKVTRLNITCIILITWTITICIDLIPFFYGETNKEKCNYVPTKLWGLCVIIIYNLFPFLCVLIIYSIIWRVAHKFAKEDKVRADSIKLNHTNLSQKQNLLVRQETSVQKAIAQLKFSLELKATKTSLAIVGVYLICWIPMGIFYMADHFCNNCISDDKNLKNTRRAVKLLAFTSSLLAPLIYCWWNEQFRRAARRLLRFNRNNSDSFMNSINE